VKKKQFVNIVDIILKLMSLFWDCGHDFEIDHIILKLITLFCNWWHYFWNWWHYRYY